MGGCCSNTRSRIKENDFHLEAFQSIAREYPIGKLRWSIIHLQSIDEARLKALKDLGAGASAQTWIYLSDRRRPAVPPHRRLWNPRWRGNGLDQCLRARSLAVAVLHDDRPESRGHADQRRPADFASRSASLSTRKAPPGFPSTITTSARSLRGSTRTSPCSVTTTSPCQIKRFERSNR